MKNKDMISSVSTILFLNFISPWFGNAQCVPTFNVIKFGAKPNGQSDATQPFLRAWASACASNMASTIYVPQGRYLIRSVKFGGPCKNAINVRIDGILVAPVNFRALGNSKYWITFVHVNRLTVVGGYLDAKGTGLWTCKSSGHDCPDGARSLTFNWVNDAQIIGLTSINSQRMHLVIHSCKNVKVSNVRIIAPRLSPNTDGIHVQASTEVTILNSMIKTGDDCISIGPGTTNLWMENIQCGPGHGISIGSLGKQLNEDGVENVTLINSVLVGSDNGLRIKAWARRSNGFVRNINYQNIVMKNVKNPIIIDQNYCPNHQDCPHQSSGIKISEVTYQNIRGTSATQVAMAFDCSPTNPCSDIKLDDIKITYLNSKKAESFCKNIVGSTDGVIMPENCL